MNHYSLPDGSYDLQVKGRTFILTIEGIVDVELALRYMLDFKLEAEALNEPYWATLLDLTQWGLHPPEVFAFLTEFESWAKDNGHLTEAAVVDKSVLKVMVRNHMVSPYRKLIQQEYFETKDAAIEWLQMLQLYPEG